MKVQVVYNDGLYGDYFIVVGKNNNEIKSLIKDEFKNRCLDIKKDLINIIKI